jgi:hypothetical protein
MFLALALAATGAWAQQTECLYDVIGPAAELRRFQSPIDFTGLGATVCAAGALGACPSDTRATGFPDAVGGIGGLESTCKSPSGYVRPLIPNSSAPSCAGDDCYLLTKVQAVPGPLVLCTVQTDPAVLLPLTLPDAA